MTLRKICILPVLQLFNARKDHRIQADWRILMEPLGCQTCFYSREDNPYTLQAACPQGAPECHCMSHCMLLDPQWEAPTPLSTNTDKDSRVLEYIVYITHRDSMHASPFNVMETVYQTVSRLWEHSLSKLPRHLGAGAGQLPFTLQPLFVENNIKAEA